MFKKKSTREIVQGAAPTVETVAGESPINDGTEKSVKKEKRKKEKEKREKKPIPAFLKTRFFYGIAAVVLGFLLVLGGVPWVYRQVAHTVSVYTFAANVPAGTAVTEDLLTPVEMSLYHLPDGAILNLDDCLGKYLIANAMSGDYVTETRLTEVYSGSNPELLTIPEGKVAISVSLPNLAQSVSGKIRSGDVIRIYAVENGNTATDAISPGELQYVEVLAVTMHDGADVENKGGASNAEAVSDDYLQTVTLLCNSEQAARCCGLSQNATMYAAIVVRGDVERKAKVLAAQEEFFADGVETAEGKEAVSE